MTLIFELDVNMVKMNQQWAICLSQTSISSKGKTIATSMAVG